MARPGTGIDLSEYTNVGEELAARQRAESLASPFGAHLPFALQDRERRRATRAPARPASFSTSEGSLRNMKRALYILAACATCAASVAAPAAAQRIDSPYRFLDPSRHVGVYAGPLSASDGVLQLGPHAGTLMGARGAIRVSGPISLGMDISYTSTRRTVRDTVFVVADSTFLGIGEADMRLLGVMADVRFSITGPRTWNSLQPFVSLGVGGVTDLAGRPALEEDIEPTARFSFGTSFAGHVGAGIDWFAVDRISLRVDARSMMWRLGVPEAFLLTEGGRNAARSTWENNFLLAAGVSYHF
jgi:opacity protein-like surface antigen